MSALTLNTQTFSNKLDGQLQEISSKWAEHALSSMTPEEIESAIKNAILETKKFIKDTLTLDQSVSKTDFVNLKKEFDRLQMLTASGGASEQDKARLDYIKMMMKNSPWMYTEDGRVVLK